MGILEGLKRAFEIPKEEEKLTSEEEKLLTLFAQEIAKRRLSAIAITFLESVKYMNFLSSQAMLFFKPIVDAIFPTQVYGKIQKLLEKRPSIEYLIQKIEKRGSSLRSE